MNWDFDNPHTYDITVQADDIDELGHANNAIYVRWLERCAWQHSKSLGLGLDEYRELDRAMAIVHHQIDYLAAGYEGDELTMATWIVHWDKKLRMTRHFQLCRKSDGATLLRARTTFACIELSTGRPKRMPPIFIEGYGKAISADATAE
ncbi:acyl-CoA thioesterase [Halopseudomonas nanhaiensis]|uniref:acyl-CoA thioesterase n=1 Tax=Halopseudomonas nanhaiensis TaxID=2830842 RepID=UPI001CBEE637|nr:thioesterase family protein [Halopseudomonas nanhaiensis]UAW99519.1 acyl-CoA thioesterase [Halopseudomonas nanhaiensis]